MVWGGGFVVQCGVFLGVCCNALDGVVLVCYCFFWCIGVGLV